LGTKDLFSGGMPLYLQQTFGAQRIHLMLTTMSVWMNQRQRFLLGAL
jgi:hypothetical protein